MLAKALLQDFGADALIQAAQDIEGLSDREFSKVLVEELYRDSSNELNDAEWELFLKGLGQPQVGHLRPSEIRAFLELVRRKYSGLSALALAEVIADAVDTASQPQSVLSFNAERLLFTLANMVVAQRRMDRGGEPIRAGNLARHLELVMHSTTFRSATRVPYFMCHGALPVPKQRRIAPLESVDKLVFSESTYLQLANSSFSWQSSVFLEAVVTRPIIFVGMSMSDPNVRRWLGWAHENRTREILGLGREAASTHHYWIRRDPQDADQTGWIESSVAHLGVRVVWIPNWGDLGEAIRVMIGLSRPSFSRQRRQRRATRRETRESRPASSVGRRNLST